ncbi:hypothetical protein JCGZ_10433 [Jatropha curcas]|uniref:Uncharacterized protein n=1 Tax=Jatropha curcas TaxID=180498 RepID=A0A067KI73_JATCU|nr:hypothetical protein JCGZ_10433 [Jatropha curcas]
MASGSKPGTSGLLEDGDGSKNVYKRGDRLGSNSLCCWDVFGDSGVCESWNSEPRGPVGPSCEGPDVQSA